jgi:hypothetical protein
MKGEAAASPFGLERRRIGGREELCVRRRLWGAAALLLGVLAQGQTQESAAPVNSQSVNAPLVNLSTHSTTALATVAQIGLQTRSPVGIIPGRDLNSLCRLPYTFVLLGQSPENALLAVAQQMHYSLTQDHGVFLLTAPDVTPHQQAVLHYRMHIFRSGKRDVAQSIGTRLSVALWIAMNSKTNGGVGRSTYNSVDAPRISLPPVLRDVTPLEVADRVVTLIPGGLYLSMIAPERTDRPEDFRVRFYSYGEPDQLKLDLACPQ